ncbi:hypothetical protein CQ14_06685 [Bradyrhizobium lablabi]|uniref:Uncharacterized protein n=1 Tax=Bradyrhizobium lablabi TaxID=722472 RepID=A0A0R3MM91_9BRAD|nr:hypothetical protein [Bradyrhizobium lablabi]KRR21330.1 hypothetical protein CQ14_06685 [Bradyrhizobium lablabi]
MSTNRKPPDELADVRERIKELKGREEELRDLLISGKADLVGDDYAAKVSTVTSERIDGKKLRRDLGHQFLEPFLVTVESTVVNVERMRGEG